MLRSRLAYISFDTVPAPKGAAVHIAAFTQALGGAFGGVELVTVAPTLEAVVGRELWPQVRQLALPAVGDTLIRRVLDFRLRLGQWWQGRRFEVVQVRSPFEGFPIALNKDKLGDRLIFEVNGLPSIELKYRYPAVAEDTELMQKLVAQEQVCLDAADLVVTPSVVTQAYLVSRGVAASKIRVIPNGVDLEIFRYQAPCSECLLEAPLAPQIWGEIDSKSPKFGGFRGQRFQPHPFHLLYFGTLSAWQGVGLTIEALALYCRDFSGRLTIVGQGRGDQAIALQKLAAKLGVADRMQIIAPVSQGELVNLMHQADAIAAPLTANDRNLVQGCCPLKVLEGMASGTPVIASDLPVVREFGTADEHFLLVQPGSAKAFKDAMVRLKTEAELGARLAIAARQRIETHYTWHQAGAALVTAYEELGIKRSQMV
ncbi:MAG: glycosyltransferase family 4 protein [Trichocoleus desertorum ATA4-8-CV12]|jgi:glycosyltransferase involved in cell wall biosynthesis|nr:glycosyltransferase family 4 protein [Trichocoleus desertorum ATA4-8-CV12]